MPPLVPVRREREIIPQGAGQIAGRFRAVAAAYRRHAADLRAGRANLDRVWAGRSHDRFLQEYGFATAPAELEAVAASLEEQARRIEAKRVTIEEIILVPGPVPQ